MWKVIEKKETHEEYAHAEVWFTNAISNVMHKRSRYIRGCIIADDTVDSIVIEMFQGGSLSSHSIGPIVGVCVCVCVYTCGKCECVF